MQTSQTKHWDKNDTISLLKHLAIVVGGAILADLLTQLQGGHFSFLNVSEVTVASFVIKALQRFLASA